MYEVLDAAVESVLEPAHAPNFPRKESKPEIECINRSSVKMGCTMPNVTHTFLYCGVEGKTNKEIRARFSELKAQALEDGAKEVKLELICYGTHTGHWVFSQVFNNASEYGVAMDKWHVRWASDEQSQTKHRWKGHDCIDLIAISGT
jgi:hypothetical protein